MGSLRRRFLVLALLQAVGHAGSSSSHYMRNLYTALSDPGQGLPQFIEVGYVDDQPITRYDSHTRRKVPQAPWMEKVVEDEAGYWEGETQIAQANEAVFRVDLVTLRDRFHQKNSTGFHTWQLMYGCEVGPDGRFSGGKWQYAYDGDDFLALDTETLTWTARVPQAQETKRRWEAKGSKAERANTYLEEECVAWLRRYLGYGNETVQRTEAPTARVARKKGYDGRETLVCQLHGFYPKEVDVTWRKGGEVQHQDTFTGGVVPNSDGTYHTWLSIEVDPQERDHYRCHVEHDSLLEPLDLAWEEPAPNLGLILGIVGAVLLAVAILVGVRVAFYRRKQKEKGYEAASTFAGSDQGSDTSTKISVPA